MKTRNDFLPLIASVALAIAALQETAQGALPNVERPHTSVTDVSLALDYVAGVGVDISGARQALASALVDRLQGKGVDIS